VVANLGNSLLGLGGRVQVQSLRSPANPAIRRRIDRGAALAFTLRQLAHHRSQET